MAPQKIVIIGGGFAGITVARALRKKDCEIFLVDKKNHHLFQPLLYQVASAALSPADIATPLREVFRDQKNINVIMGSVESIDKEGKSITFANGDTLPFDALVVAVGASHSYFGHDEWAQFAPGLKTIPDAIAIREKILTSFEKAERLSDQKKAQPYLNFAIIGGGPTGVEMAGSIAEIAHKTMFKNFRRINPENSNIFLIEGMDRILPPYPEKLSLKAQKTLEKMGVKVLTKSMVTQISDEGVQIGDTFIASKNVIWAAGNQASPLLKTLNTELDRAGRAVVENDLSIPNHPDIFVIGDAACAHGKNDKPLPGVAPVAIQMGGYVGHVLRKDIPKEKRKPFSYFDKGSLATIGTNKAVGFFGKIQFSGFIAWLIWGFIHITYLVGYRNRFAVTLDWVFHYFTGIRGARLIHNPIDHESDSSHS